MRRGGIEDVLDNNLSKTETANFNNCKSQVTTPSSTSSINCIRTHSVPCILALCQQIDGLWIHFYVISERKMPF